jgi:peroxiredoxin Q/BCP
MGAVVIGMSADPVAALAKFRKKCNLNFPLVSDPEHNTLLAYGVWAQKSFMGKKFMGVERTTYLLDPEGRVQQVFPKVKVMGHTAQVLAALRD